MISVKFLEIAFLISLLLLVLIMDSLGKFDKFFEKVKKWNERK